MTLEGYFPAFEHMTNFGLQSSIRLASSWAANPPKTITWVAPIRAQAWIAMRDSIVIGM